MLDLTAEQLATVQSILCQHVPDREVQAFGSRVTGKAKPYSDLDLVIMGDIPLDFRTVAALKDTFAESDLPFRVDVVEWATTGDNFRAIIRERSETVQGHK
jgi:predicted nucleotidyltransferase